MFIDDDDYELFLRNGSSTEGLKPYLHCKSQTRREENLNLRRTSIQGLNKEVMQ